MQDPKILKFFQEVLDKTRQRKIRWTPTAMEKTYLATFGGEFVLLLTTASLADSMLADGRVGFGARVLILKDSNDRELLRVDETTEGVTKEDLDELFAEVQRSALRLDKKVDQALADLSRL